MAIFLPNVNFNLTEEDKKSQLIFYGSGSFAEKNEKYIYENGITPVCYADRDPNKHNQVFFGVTIYSIEEATRLFPNALIVLTVGVEHISDVATELINKGLNSEKIKYCFDVEWKKSCYLLQYECGFEDSNLYFCCWTTCSFMNVLSKLKTDSTKNIYDIINSCRESIQSEIDENKKNVCTGCYRLNFNYWLKNPYIRLLTFGSGFKGDICNYKCPGCSDRKILEIKQENRSLSIMSVLNWLKNDIDNKRFDLIDFHNGEPTLSKDFNNIVDFLDKCENDFPVMFASNSYIYNPLLKKISEKRLCRVTTDLSAGTEETYKKIKGCFGLFRVIENLRKYKNDGIEIDLKYIVFPGVNDNEKEFLMFLDIVTELDAVLWISTDVNLSDSKNNKMAKEMLGGIYNILKERNLKFKDIRGINNA
jgi:pyruvate-formate lyase-activating enzyme